MTRIMDKLTVLIQPDQVAMCMCTHTFIFKKSCKKHTNNSSERHDMYVHGEVRNKNNIKAASNSEINNDRSTIIMIQLPITPVQQ